MKVFLRGVALLAVTWGGLSASGGECAAIDAGDILVASAGYHYNNAPGAIFKVDPHNGDRAKLFYGGNLDCPADLAIDAQGDLLVVDTSCHTSGASKKVLRIDPQTGAQTVVSSGGGFVSPAGIAVGVDGAIYVVDGYAMGNQAAIFRIDPVTGSQTTVTSGGLLALAVPMGIAVGPDGGLFVANSNGFSAATPGVVRVDPASGAQTAVASGGEFFDTPWDLVVAHDGTMYVTNQHSNTPGRPGVTGVIRIDPGTGQQTMLSTGAILTGPHGIAIDVDGTLLVTNTDQWGDSYVVRIDPQGGASILSTFPVDSAIWGVTVYPNISTPSINATWGSLKASYR
jgi:DNA-binding beta-propeller fold protein YncE